jgi:hypothetical protein
VTHNLEALTPFDFESLSKSLLEPVLGVRLEIFKPGRDGGVDLYHAFDGKNGLVVQCKHWPMSTAATLASAFRREELPKMVELKPSRYFISTSTPLKRSEKESLVSDMAPFIKSTGDIWGRDEIESQLESNPEVVKSQIRLWLNNASVLQALLHQATNLRSRDLVDRIRADLPTFVATSGLKRAQRILEDRRVVVISGQPGIGKTTIAHILCAELISGVQPYDLVSVSRDIDEANEVWNDETPQVFVYDDFLGRSARGDQLSKNEDQRILDFCVKVAAHSNKVFIMTTRGYILGQAKEVYERLTNERFSYSECVIELSDLSKEARAFILYNHVWASDLSQDDKSLFADPEVFWPILKHANYSPRLVRLSLERPGLSSSDRNPAEIMLANMQNPEDLWRHAVEKQLSSNERLLLDLFASVGASVDLETLRSIWSELVAEPAHESDAAFDRAFTVLEGDFLAIAGTADEPEIRSSNPSIDDFMNLRLRRQVTVLTDFASRTPSFAHLQGLSRIFQSARAANESTIPKAKLDALNYQIIASGIRLISSDGGKGQPAETSEGEWIRRLDFLVRIANNAAQRDLVKGVLSRFYDLVEAPSFDLLLTPSVDADDVALLFRRLVGGDWEMPTSVEDSLQTQFNEFLTEDTSDWETQTWAQALVEMLPSHGMKARTETYLYDLGYTLTERTFEEWITSEGQSDDVEIRYARDFVDATGLTGEFESFDLIDERLRAEDRQKNESLSESWDATLLEIGQDQFDIEALMEGLGNQRSL